VIGWLAAVIAVLVTTGCAIGDPGRAATQTRTVAGVTAVDLRTSGTLVITQGERVSLQVTAGENVIDRLTSDVRGGSLVLSVRRPGLVRLGTVRYDLVVPSLDGVRVSGSGGVESSGDLGPRLAVETSGSGSVRAEGLKLERLDVSISGSGSVQLVGSASRQTARISGSGGYAAGRLKSREAEVTISGSGNADLTVTDSLDAEISGSGSITYAGGATVNARTSGSGRITER
jgi:hypothetical protein